MNNLIRKPVTVACEDFRNQLTDLINNSQLPLFVLQPILKEMFSTIDSMLVQQTANDRAEYERLLFQVGENENDTEVHE